MTSIWAMIGAEDVDVPDGPGARPAEARMCHPSEAMACQQFLARKAADHFDLEKEVVRRLLDRDRQARSESRVNLTVLCFGTRVVRHATIETEVPCHAARAGRKPARGHSHRAGTQKKPCARFNGKKGYTHKEKDCPDETEDTCSRCGNWRHWISTDGTHPRRVAAQALGGFQGDVAGAFHRLRSTSDGLTASRSRQ